VNVTTRESPNITIERKQVHLTDIIMLSKRFGVYYSNVTNLKILLESALAFP